MADKIIVTRYPQLAEHLKQTGVVPEDTPVLGRVRPEDVDGRHVFGTVPMWLASFADRVTEYVMVSATVDLASVRPEDVGRYLRTPITYRVERLGVGVDGWQ